MWAQVEEDENNYAVTTNKILIEVLSGQITELTNIVASEITFSQKLNDSTITASANYHGQVEGVLTKVHPFFEHEDADMLVDGIESTACYGLVPERYIDFDLGMECRLTAFGLYLYLKSEVTEGNYELLYWNEGRWCTAGMQTADGKGCLTFGNVPLHSLLMLKNRNKGWDDLSSERPFIYREGGHISWE